MPIHERYMQNTENTSSMDPQGRGIDHQKGFDFTPIFSAMALSTPPKYLRLMGKKENN